MASRIIGAIIMIITKELKKIAKSADYYFIHVDNHTATIELMSNHDAKGDYNPCHVASYSDIPCNFYDFSHDKYNGYNGKARIYIDQYNADTMLSLIQVLHVGTDIMLTINACGNSQVHTEAGLVYDEIHLTARRNNKEIGKFLLFVHVGKNNSARPIDFTRF